MSANTQDWKDAALQAGNRISELQQRITELEALVTKWVSVDERLPEVGVKVICFGGLLTDLGFTYQTDFAVMGNDKEWIFFEGTISDGWNITHWMPLPQPPKGESDE